MHAKLHFACKPYQGGWIQRGFVADLNFYNAMATITNGFLPFPSLFCAGVPFEQQYH